MIKKNFKTKITNVCSTVEKISHVRSILFKVLQLMNITIESFSFYEKNMLNVLKASLTMT